VERRLGSDESFDNFTFKAALFNQTPKALAYFSPVWSAGDNPGYQPGKTD
jgi:hypothetical protein